jgi:hypothetical protein
MEYAMKKLLIVLVAALSFSGVANANEIQRTQDWLSRTAGPAPTVATLPQAAPISRPQPAAPACNETAARVEALSMCKSDECRRNAQRSDVSICHMRDCQLELKGTSVATAGQRFNACYQQRTGVRL